MRLGIFGRHSAALYGTLKLSALAGNDGSAEGADMGFKSSIQGAIIVLGKAGFFKSLLFRSWFLAPGASAQLAMRFVDRAHENGSLDLK